MYLSYKIYNDDKFNDYDKTMLKITSVIQSLIFVYNVINYKNNINTYNYLVNNLKLDLNYNLLVIFLIMLYYGYSLYINYKNFNNEYNLDDLNDEKNKNLKIHIYLSIPLLLLVVSVLYKSYKFNIINLFKE